MEKKFTPCMMVGVILGLFFGVACIQAADTPGMAGKWEFNIDYLIWNSRGQQTVVFEIQQEGGKITGKSSGPFGNREIIGEILGSDFEFMDNCIDKRDFITTIKYKGKVDGNRTTGSSEYEWNGNIGKGTFTGERK
jgi:hypothetical protein